MADLDDSVKVDVATLAFVKDPLLVWMLVETVPDWVVWTPLEEVVSPAGEV